MDLGNLHSQLSEEAYSAGWMSGLEYALSNAVLTGPFQYGRLSIDEIHITRLEELANAYSGWIVFEDRDFERWVPMGHWVKKTRTTARVWCTFFRSCRLARQ